MTGYKKVFGTLRIMLGILFLSYPTYEFLNQVSEESGNSLRWLFVFLFFMIYAYSSVKNGLRELGGLLPEFNLTRFFEASMNGFLSLYLIIISFSQKLNVYAKFFIILITVLTLLTMIRDLRILSLQYYVKKQKQKREEE